MNSSSPFVPSDPLMLQETREIPAVLRRQRELNTDITRKLAAHLREQMPPYAVTIARGSVQTNPGAGRRGPHARRTLPLR